LDSVWFLVGFFLIHLVAYVVAGMVSQLFSQDIYGEEGVLSGYVRDVGKPEERRRQGLVMVPAQLIRAVLMALVLLLILEPLEAMGYGQRALFLGGLMFVYTDIAAAVPFTNTIEGLVYLEPGLVSRSAFWKVQAEGIIYAILFGLGASWLLF
jgi:hypothetical protein